MITIDRDLRRIHHRQRSRRMPLLEEVERAAQRRYAILAVKG